jgi:hypothetical protein
MLDSGAAESEAVLGIRTRRIRMFFGHPDPLVRDMDPDPSLFLKCVERTEKILVKIEF